MKQLPEILIVSSLLASNIQFTQAEPSDSYVDSLSIEADQTSMKPNKAAIVTDEGPEPAVVPDASDDIDALSRNVANHLEQILAGSSSKDVKRKKIAKIVSTAVKKGHEIDAIQSAVSDAMAELSKQERLDIKPETLEFAEKTLNEIIEGSKAIAQGDPNDPYIKSLNAEVSETSLLENDGKVGKITSIPTETKAKIKSNVQNTEIAKADVTTHSEQPTFRTIVVLKGESLSTIAGKIYGSVNKYHLLFEANRDILNNPDLIIIGQILKVPLLPAD